MEYTNNEKQILSLMERTNFRNLSKNDVLSYASKLNELRPEVAQQIIAQFPELAKLIQSTMVEYKDILEKIVASDDESTNQVYGILNKEIDNASYSRKEFNWKILCAASLVVLTAIGIGAATLGGKIDFKLPSKS